MGLSPEAHVNYTTDIPWWLWLNQGAVLDQGTAGNKQQQAAEEAISVPPPDQERSAPTEICPAENPVTGRTSVSQAQE